MTLYFKNTFRMKELCFTWQYGLKFPFRHNFDSQTLNYDSDPVLCFFMHKKKHGLKRKKMFLLIVLSSAKQKVCFFSRKMPPFLIIFPIFFHPCHSCCFFKSNEKKNMHQNQSSISLVIKGQKHIQAQTYFTLLLRCIDLCF